MIEFLTNHQWVSFLFCSVISAVFCFIPVPLTAWLFKPMRGQQKPYWLYGLLAALPFCIVLPLLIRLGRNGIGAAIAFAVCTIGFAAVEFFVLRKGAKNVRRLLAALVVQWVLILLFYNLSQIALRLFFTAMMRYRP